MKVYGKLKSTKVLVLVDGGLTHNFISDMVVKELRLVTQLITPLRVQIGNGDIRCGQIFKNLSVQALADLEPNLTGVQKIQKL